MLKFPINPDILGLLEFEKAKQLGIVPFYRNGYKIRLATVDPKVKGIDLLVSQFEDKRMNESGCVFRSVFSARLSLYHSELVEKKTVELTRI